MLCECIAVFDTVFDCECFRVGIITYAIAIIADLSNDSLQNGKLKYAITLDAVTFRRLDLCNPVVPVLERAERNPAVFCRIRDRKCSCWADAAGCQKRIVTLRRLWISVLYLENCPIESDAAVLIGLFQDDLVIRLIILIGKEDYMLCSRRFIRQNFKGVTSGRYIDPRCRSSFCASVLSSF